MSNLHRVYRIASFLLIGMGAQQACWGEGPLDAGSFPAGVVDRQSLPAERAYNYNFTDVQASQIEGWLRWIGYELPVDVSGQVSGWLWAQRSSQGWLKFSDYRVEGELESPQLQIDSWVVQQANLRFGYRDGVWYVGRLSGRLGQQARGAKQPVRAIGQADLTAAVPMASPRLLKISGHINEISLQPLMDAFALGSDISIDNQPGRLAFNGQVPVASITDATAWNLGGDIAVRGIRLQTATPLPELSISSPIRLESGQWSISRARVGAAEQLLEVDAQGDLNDARLPYELAMSGSNIDLRAVISAFDAPPANSPERLPIVQGLATLDGRITGSVSGGFEAVTLNVSSPSVLAVGEVFTDVRLQASLPIDAGIPQGLAIRLQQASLAHGRLRGLVTWSSMVELAAGLPTQVDLDFEQCELGRIDPTRLPVALTGLADGQVRLHITPPRPARDWSGEVRLRVRSLAAANTPLGDTYLTLSKAVGAPQISFAVHDSQQTLSLHGTCGLAGVDDAARLPVQLTDYTVTGELRDYHTQVDLRDSLGARFASVPVSANGQFQLSGRLDNARENLNQLWPSRGSAALDTLSIDLDGQVLHLQDARLNIQPTAWRIERFRLVSSQRPNPSDVRESSPVRTVTEGRVVGSAIIRRDAQGEHLLNLRVAELELEPFLASLAPQALHGLKGKVNIETRLKKPANEPLLAAGWLGQFAGQLRDVSFRDVGLSELAFGGELQSQRIALQVAGSLLGGELDAKVDLPMQQLTAMLNAGTAPQGISRADNASADIPSAGSSNSQYELDATLKAAQLNRLMGTIFGRQTGSKYAGTADLRVTASSPTTGGSPIVDANLRIPNFNFERQSLAQDLQATLRYRDGNLVIDSLGGGIAGGRIEVAGELREDVQGVQVGDLRFAAEQLQLPAMLAWFAPEQVGRYSGTFNYSGRALVGREIQLTGAARLSDAMLSGYAIQSVRSHLSVWLARSGRLHEVSTRSISGTALGGTARGSARLHGDTRYEFTSNFEIANGKLDQLSRALGFERIIGTGRFDAQAALHSDDAGKLSALTGPLRLDFQSGDAAAVPILADLGRLLPVLQLSATDINNGRLNAQFGQGQLRLLNFYLTSDAFWLVGNGTTSLATGGLDISAVISTGGGIESQIAQGASQKLIAAALPQLLLFTQLNDLVRNRTVYLRIGGRTSRPVIQPQLAPTLARVLLQNVRRSLLATPAADAANQN